MVLVITALAISILFVHWYLSPNNQLYRLALELGIPNVSRKAIRADPARFLQRVTDVADDRSTHLWDEVDSLITWLVDDGTLREDLRLKLDSMPADQGRRQRCTALFDLLLELDHPAMAAHKTEWQWDCEDEALALEAAYVKLDRISARIR